MLFRTWYEESTHLGSIPSQVERLPFFESNFSVLSTGKKHFARIMQESYNSLFFSFLLTLQQGLERTGGELQMHQLSLRNNRLKFETSRELLIILEEYLEEYPSNE